MSYHKISITIIISLLIMISCASQQKVSEEIQSQQSIPKTTDIHTAYAWFASTAQSLSTLANQDKLDDSDESIKNGIIKGYKLLPLDRFTFGLSKNELQLKIQDLGSNNITDLIAGVIIGLVMVDEFDKANSLINNYCDHTDTISMIQIKISDITNDQFTNQYHNKIKLCN